MDHAGLFRYVVRSLKSWFLDPGNSCRAHVTSGTSVHDGVWFFFLRMSREIVAEAELP